MVIIEISRVHGLTGTNEKTAKAKLIDVAVNNTMTLTNDRIITDLRLRADENWLSPMGTAVSMTVGTTSGYRISQGFVSKMVKNAIVEMVSRLEVM